MTLSAGGAVLQILGSTIRAVDTTGARATLRVDGQDISCAARETVSVNGLDITCTSVGADRVQFVAVRR